MKIVLEGRLDYKIENIGKAVICEFIDPQTHDDPNFFVRLQSWSDIPCRPQAECDLTGNPETKLERVLKNHPTMQAMAGKKVRVTIEIIG